MMQQTLKLKILFTLTPALNPNAGGVQRTTYNLGKYFTEQGISVSYFSMEDKGHEIVSYGSLFQAPEPGGVKNRANHEKLIDTLKGIRPDIVINQMPYERNLTNTLAGYKNHLNISLLGCLHNSLFSVVNNLDDYVHGVVPKAWLPFVNHKIGRAFMLQLHKYKHARDLRHILEQHDKFIVLAPPIQKELAYFVGGHGHDKAMAIPNGITYRQTEVSTKEKIILHVGRLSIAQKRSDLLLPFWQEMHSKLPDWRFVIVGDGPYRKIMERGIMENNIPRVEMAGFQKPEPYFEKAAMFIMPSAFEGFPNTILEAQSYGCPVLAFNSYATLAWIVNDGMDALLIKPFDTTQMAAQAVALAGDTSRLTRMQTVALQNAGRFTIGKVGKQWLQLFKELCP